jgi:hypothetical protein
MPETPTTRYRLTIDLPIEDASRAPEVVRRDLARRAYEAGLRGDVPLARHLSAAAAPLGCDHAVIYRRTERRGRSVVERCDRCGSIRNRKESR